MIITPDQIHSKWRSVDFSHGGYIQLEITHPLEWYIGYKGIDEKTLLVISANEPERIPSSKSLLVTKGLRTDGRWALTFTLMRKDQDSVFETLCADIICYSETAADDASALLQVAKRYKQWDKLLEHQRKSLMDESSRKGLFGELVFLNQVMDNGRPALPAVQGWVGPDGADQDFAYDSFWHEIKTVGISADSITISSLEQLNTESSGEIVVMRVDKCAPQHADARSLAEEVDLTVERISSDSDALTLLENKLSKYGYIDLPEYREQKYHYSGRERFFVGDGFPRLTSANVPTQITAAQYSISLAGIAAWKMEE